MLVLRHGEAFMSRSWNYLAFALAAVVFWTGLGAYGLVESSDARYAEIARDMRDSSDWLFPRLLGIHHFDKPPLIYWLSAGGHWLLGENEWGARACLGFLGLILCAVLWRFGRRHLGPMAAVWSVVLVATMPAVIAAGRMLTADLLLTVCLTLALTGWYDVWSGIGGRGPLVAFYTGVGLAFLAKGPVAWLLLLLVLVPHSLLNRGASARRVSWGAGWGIPLALAIALPWYVIVAWKTPGLFSYLVVEQIASRLHEGGLGHPRPWFYFLGIFPVLGLPWMLLAPGGWRYLRGRRSPLAVFLGLWSLVPPLFFSIPATKLPLYALPAYPAVSLLGAALLAGSPRAVARDLRAAGGMFLLLGMGLVLVSLGAVMPHGGDLLEVHGSTLRALCLPLAAACLAGGFAALGWARKRPLRAAMVLSLALGFLPAWGFSRGDTLPLRSAREVGRAAEALRQPDDILAEYGDLTAGLGFYAHGLPLLAGIARELRFDEEAPGERVLTRKQFLRLWSGPRRMLVVTRGRHLRDLPAARVLTWGEGYVLVSNQ
jgi:4-amino-4-deoxy-L-arabinose transferase-like glycosyltransferase